MAYQIISNVLCAAQPLAAGAGPYDLVDLPTVLDELQIPASNTGRLPFLQRAITAVSASISSYCNRVFQVETIRDTLYPDRDAYPYQVPGTLDGLQLSRWPLITTAATLTTAADAPANSTTLTVSSTTGLAVGMPAHAPSLPTALAYDSTIAAIAGATITLSAPTTADVPAGTAISFGLRVSIQDPQNTWTDLVLGTDYLINARDGSLSRLNRYTGYPSSWEPVQTNVRYQAGFATIPADVVQAALQMVGARNDDRDRDPYLKAQEQPGLGRQEYWVGGLPGVKGIFPEAVLALLDAYRVPMAT